MAGAVHGYALSTQTAAPPAHKGLRLDAAPALATRIYFDNHTADNADIHDALLTLKAPDDIGLQDVGDHAHALRFTVAGFPIDRDQYVEVPVTFIEQRGAAFVDGPVDVVFYVPITPAPPTDEPRHTHYHATAGGSLVALEIAKEHLRIRDDDHDAEVTRKARHATDIVLDYLKHSADPTWTESTVPLPVQAAILLMLTHLYEDRGDRAKDTDADADDKLWGAIDRLLARFRDPAIA